MIVAGRPARRRGWPARSWIGPALALVLVSACTSTSAASSTGTTSVFPSSTAAAATAAPTSTSTATADSAVPKATANDLAKNSAHRLVAIDGESFKLKVDYWTTVDAATWDVTGPKNVHLLAYLQPAAATTSPNVVIDRFSPAFTLLAANTGLQGVAAGNIVDADAGGTAIDSAGISGSGLPGFLLTDKVSYGSQFGTTGVSAALMDRWQQLAPHQVLSEAALQRAGVYAVRAAMTYRLLVRNAGDTGWHRRTVVDTLTVPVKVRS